jgi:hypothetical protein
MAWPSGFQTDTDSVGWWDDLPTRQAAGRTCLVGRCGGRSQEKEGLPDLRGALDRNGQPLGGDKAVGKAFRFLS